MKKKSQSDKKPKDKHSFYMKVPLDQWEKFRQLQWDISIINGKHTTMRDTMIMLAKMGAKLFEKYFNLNNKTNFFIGPREKRKDIT